VTWTLTSDLQSRQWVNGSNGSLFDGSHWSWVTSFLPMTHQGDMCHPLRNGRLVHLTSFNVLQLQLLFHQHLLQQHLSNRWRTVYTLKEIRSYETESLLCHAESDIFWSPPPVGQHEEMYPLLSDCARSLLVIPASSAECERHFSAFNARNIITSQRNMMFPETVEAPRSYYKATRINWFSEP